MDELSVVLQNPQALITLAILLMAVVLFISGALAPELTGVLSLSLLITSGVLSPQTALAGFGSPALITLMGLFAVSAALFKSGALDRLRELIASESIRTPRRLIALLGLVVAPILGGHDSKREEDHSESIEIVDWEAAELSFDYNRSEDN